MSGAMLSGSLAVLIPAGGKLLSGRGGKFFLSRTVIPHVLQSLCYNTPDSDIELHPQFLQKLGFHPYIQIRDVGAEKQVKYIRWHPSMARAAPGT